VETSSICAEALRTRKRVIAPDVEILDYIVNTPEIEFFRLSGIRGVQTTPLVTRTGSIVGMISTHWRTVHEPSERELRILDILAWQTADIIQNAQAEQLRQARERELAVLEERQRFAREVHDGASQSIFAANVAIETVQRIWSRKPERALELLDQIHRLTTGAVAEMRMLLLELRPENVVKTKLSDLLDFHVQSVQIRRGITVSLEIDDQYDFSLPETVHFVFYRIAQESLNNIAKHAGAKRARIRLRGAGDQVELTIVDNGSGFEPRPESSGFGLTSMRERADSIGAAFHVQSRVGTGTRVRLRWQPDSIISSGQTSPHK
jgi:signal transduction histidine kinase